MNSLPKPLSTMLVSTIIVTTLSTLPQKAEAYSIDCAILICLSGGWAHPSAECTAAKIEFMRRITPWPIEPPIQIWNCPLGVAHSPAQRAPRDRLYEAAFRTTQSPFEQNHRPTSVSASFNLPNQPDNSQSILRLIGDTYSDENGVADVDISDPTFDFLRSIRVFNVHIDDDSNPDDGCGRYAKVKLGSYGLQGDFGWSDSNRTEIPAAFGPTTQGCRLKARAVFIDWNDYSGNYGYARVDY